MRWRAPAYLASVEIAKEKGPVPALRGGEVSRKRRHFAAWMRTFAPASRNTASGTRFSPPIAPTGTISLLAGNVSSGIEPVFALFLPPQGPAEGRNADRGGGGPTYAVQLWRDLHGEAPFPDHFVNAQTLAPSDHKSGCRRPLRKWVDSSISKTINVPEDISFEAFKDVYMQAWDTGCKGCTTYRPNAVTGSVLEVTPAEPVADTMADAPTPATIARPHRGRPPPQVGIDDIPSLALASGVPADTIAAWDGETKPH